MLIISSECFTEYRTCNVNGDAVCHYQMIAQCQRHRHHHSVVSVRMCRSAVAITQRLHHFVLQSFLLKEVTIVHCRWHLHHHQQHHRRSCLHNRLLHHRTHTHPARSSHLNLSSITISISISISSTLRRVCGRRGTWGASLADLRLAHDHNDINTLLRT